MKIPPQFIKTTKHGKTVYFGGEPINLSALSVGSEVELTTLSRIFNGRRKPTIEHASALSRALGISLDEFVRILIYKGTVQVKRAC